MLLAVLRIKNSELEENEDLECRHARRAGIDLQGNRIAKL
jgi:hypothetical protein